MATPGTLQAPPGGGAGPTLEHELRAAQDPGGVHAAAVATPWREGEGGVLAHGVRVVIVVPLPAMVVVVEDEVAGQKRTRAAPRSAGSPTRAAPQLGSALGASRRRASVRAVDDAAGDEAWSCGFCSPDKGWEETVSKRAAQTHSLASPGAPCPVTRVPQGAWGVQVPACSHQCTLVLADGRARPKYFSCI